MGELLALLAAGAFALGAVLQQKGTLATEAPGDDPKFLVEILHNPVWLAGGAAQAAGWILQAVALDRAPLTVVQSLTALSLVLALPLGMWLTHQHVGSREWLGAGLVLVGLVVFLSVGQAQGGTSRPGAAAWWSACSTTLVLVIVLGGVGLRLSAARRALMFGAAAGLGFGLQAAVTKTFVTQVGNGALSLLSSWPVYVLIASAITGFVLQQSALKTGVLAPAIASSNSVTLFSSAILGVTVYGETLSKGGSGHNSAAVIGLTIAVVGVSLLAGSEPPPRVEAGSGASA